MISLLLALALLPQAGAAARPEAAPSALCSRIAELTEAPGVARAHWGVSVLESDGTALCSINALKLFRPASTNKIFTSAAALALMGAGRTFSTTVEADGTLAQGTLTGNLRLRGGGDANFGAEDVPYVPPVDRPDEPRPQLPPPPLPTTIPDIEALADQVVAQGVRSISGDVIGDDTYFAWQPYPPEWTAADVLYGYGAPVAALSIHDNKVEIRVSSDLSADVAGSAAGAAVAITVGPSVPWFTFINSAQTGVAKGSCGSQLVIERATASRAVVVSGTLPLGTDHCGGNFAIDDPAEYAALALKLALERRGVHVGGQARAQHWPAAQPGGVFTGQTDQDSFLAADFSAPVPQPVACSQPVAPPYAQPHGRVLGTHISPALMADEIFTLKTSQNLHAELLLRNLGAAFSCDRTERGSLHVLRQFLLHTGVDPDDFVLYDGSGLSGHDLVAPRGLTAFLSFAARQPWFAAWRTALPVGGIDGTLHKRFKTSLRGRVFAKTGTLGESSALAGYVVTNSGRTRTFAIMVDNHTPMSSAHHAVVDAIVEAIAADDAGSTPAPATQP